MFINEGQSFVINYHSLSLTDDVYSLFPLENCLQSYKMSNIQYSNAYHSIQYYNTMGLILIIIIISSQILVYAWACAINSMWLDHLWKWSQIRDQIFAVVETVFFHSVWNHLDTCRPECIINATGMVLELLWYFNKQKK